MRSTDSKARAVAGAASSSVSAERMRRSMSAGLFVSLEGLRMSHERDVPFHLGGRVVPLAWSSSVGVGVLFVVASLLPSQYSFTAYVVSAAVAGGMAEALCWPGLRTVPWHAAAHK